MTVEGDGRPSPDVKPGDLLVVLEGAVLADEGEIPDLHFTAPIPPLLLLDFAADCRARADAERKRLQGAMEWRDDGTWGIGPRLKSRVFDTITCAWMALEAFANFVLQKYTDDSFRYERVMPDGARKSYSAAKTEKDVSVMEKATKVLPAVFPAIGAVHADLAAQLDALRDVRRRTEHLKAADRYNADNLATGPMGILLVGRVCAPQIVCSLLRHFGERWTPARIAASSTRPCSLWPGCCCPSVAVSASSQPSVTPVSETPPVAGCRRSSSGIAAWLEGPLICSRRT